VCFGPKYLRENCDYTFATLQKTLPKALASVNLLTIRRWEHRMVCWMDAYHSGLGAKDAQFRVKQCSTIYLWKWAIALHGRLLIPFVFIFSILFKVSLFIY
jgi:hypothetical protein